ncbi:MAG TPA: 2-amino-4-hydroxy-6-hydroxymethyldihydropteridine diphosphokinase [Candidatus Sphingobacterium stercoripullorum]|uniref:2-amino-4-hydroxy-6-hydroxymethyldihydropteridine pyrophosphokinase n=1 Tax=Candidatus Sphingobacterium stercoripullorum TaxID=2838759 RepID=A0A9D1W8Y7_9SPHI|nr:2-amino-4-hydroxy-6-hydroxymethyldihydropteridine diphosphokinase [Candidatus Sphingobacterium stercoripullorum]
MSSTKNIYILLGGNQGNTEAIFHKAIMMLQSDVGTINKVSSLYKTAAWGKTDQPDFINQVLKMSSKLSPESLLQNTQQIEKLLGRERLEHWGPRVIDIDILYYGTTIVSTEHLTIPHPRIQERRFVLEPLNEISPNLIHPVLGLSQKELLAQCTDKLMVEKIMSTKENNTYSVINVQAIKENFFDNAELIKEFTDLYLSQTPEDFSRLKQAIEKENRSDSYDLAHQMKPSMEYVGASSLRIELGTLEQLLKEEQNMVTIREHFQKIATKIEILLEELKDFQSSL